MFNSIPNFITKSKNIFENKSANQIDLFGETQDEINDIIFKINDWEFEERLSKEFEAVGFFISDHPLNQYREVFEDYKIIDYQKFVNNAEIKDSNIAVTLLKIHERKTSKGNSYAVLKLSDLTSVFELFIFSDLLELNREILKEGNSFILTIIKSVNEDNRFTRINVQKIASLKDLINLPIKEVLFKIKSLKELDEISKFLINKGETTVKININENDSSLSFELKNKRNLDRKALNLLRNKEISSLIS